MNRIILPIASFALAVTSLQAAGTDPNIDYNVLQGRISSLESKVKTLEAALRELSAKVAEPSPTNTSAPVANITPPPAPPAPAPTVPPPAPPAPAAQPNVKKHAITESETVSVIAAKYNVPRAELMEANDLREGQQIYIGDVLVIPQPKASAVAKTTPPAAAAAAAAGKPANPATTTASATTQTTTYKVKSGDTLTKIARTHGTTVAAIKSTNQLKSDNLSVGQSLKIPAKGGASPSNQIATNTGSAAAGSTQVSDNSSSGTKASNALLRPEEVYGVYTVEKGDTLYSLARDFFTSQAELQRLNKMGNSTVLRPGQDVVVPTKKYSEHHNLAKNG